MKLHLIDGTYELYRAFYALPPLTAPDGRHVGAIRGLMTSLLALLSTENVTHVACSFDHVIESFRNRLFPGYKTGTGVPQELLDQFELAERAVETLGIVVWPMVEFEADDAIATAAARWKDVPEIEQVVICSPDKDLAQMIEDTKVVLLDRRKNVILDESAAIEKFGVTPQSIPDYLALVGDAADGIPGVPKWGKRSSAQLLRHYIHLEQIPRNHEDWGVKLRGAETLAASLIAHKEEALLYKKLATLRMDVPIKETLDGLEWRGVDKQSYIDLCNELGFSRILDLPHRWTFD